MNKNNKKSTGGEAPVVLTVKDRAELESNVLETCACGTFFMGLPGEGCKNPEHHATAVQPGSEAERRIVNAALSEFMLKGPSARQLKEAELAISQYKGK